MDYSLTEEQQLIQASALDWLAENYDFRQRDAGVHSDAGVPGVWQTFAQMGWLGLPIAERWGGSGGGILEASLLMQAFGRHLVVEPYHNAILLGAHALALAGSDAQREQWLPQVISGDARLAFAWNEPGDVLPWLPRRTVARRKGHHWQIDGSKQAIRGAAGATQWLITASDADQGTRQLLFLVEPTRPGVHLENYDTTEGARAADITFNGLLVEQECMVGGGADLAPILQRVVAEGVIARCWEAVGSMQAVLEQTATYTAQRKQFGQSIASFQVVQHRLAEMTVQCAEAQAVCELAAMRVAQEPSCAALMAARTRSKVGRAARYVSQEAVQLHGAMGVCEELPVAATFRALLAFRHEDGDETAHAAWLGRELLASGDFAQSQTLRDVQEGVSP